MKVLIAAIILAFSFTTTADAWVGVGPGRRGVGVGRPGAYGVGGYGRVGGPGRVGYGVGYPGRPTPFRPFVGRVYR